MKSLSILIFVFITLTFVPNTFAQAVSQRDLPEGAKALIGKGYIRDSAYSPDGARLACAGSTGIWMYNAHTGEQISRLVTSEVDSISFSPDGRTLAGCVKYGDTVSLWDAYTGDLKDTLESKGEYFRSVAYSPDGSTLAIVSSPGYDSTFADDTVRLWNVVPGQPKTSFIFPAESPGRVRFSPDGRTLAVTRRGAVDLWDVNTRDLKVTLEWTPYSRDFAYSPDSLTLAITDEKNDTVKLWDVTTGKLKFRLEHRSVFGIAYSPDGLTLVSAGSPNSLTFVSAGRRTSTVKLWDTTTGELKTSFTFELTHSIFFVEYSPDGLTLALWDWTGMSLCDAATGHLIATLEGYSGVYAIEHGVAYSPDGRTLAVMGGRAVNLWDVNTGQHKATLRGKLIRNVAYSPDGRTLASTDVYAIKLWDPNTGDLKATLEGHGRLVWALTYSPDGLTLASASLDGTIRLWDTTTGQSKAILREHAEGDDTRRKSFSLRGNLAYSPDGLTLASASGNLINLWDVNTGDLKTTLRGNWIGDVAYSPDGLTLASTSFNLINLWDVNTGDLKTTLEFGCPLISVAYSPDGSVLAAGGVFTTVQLWDTASWKQEATLRGHPSLIYGLAFSPDSSTLASGDGDGVVLLWDLTPFIPQRTQPRIAIQETHTDTGIEKICTRDGAVDLLSTQ